MNDIKLNNTAAPDSRRILAIRAFLSDVEGVEV